MLRNAQRVRVLHALLTPLRQPGAQTDPGVRPRRTRCGFLWWASPRQGAQAPRGSGDAGSVTQSGFGGVSGPSRQSECAGRLRLWAQSHHLHAGASAPFSGPGNADSASPSEAQPGPGSARFSLLREVPLLCSPRQRTCRKRPRAWGQAGWPSLHSPRHSGFSSVPDPLCWKLVSFSLTKQVTFALINTTG